MVAASTAVLFVISGNGLPIAAQKRAAGSPDMLAVQVMLDRARFSPGEIDGKGGPNTKRAIEAFERAKGGTVAEAVAAMGIEAAVAYTITAEDEAGPFDPIPEDMMEKAKLKRLSRSDTPRRTAACGSPTGMSTPSRRWWPKAPR